MKRDKKILRQNTPHQLGAAFLVLIILYLTLFLMIGDVQRGYHLSSSFTRVELSSSRENAGLFSNLSESHLEIASSKIDKQAMPVKTQQEGGEGEYKDPITNRLISEIFVKSGTIRKDSGDSIILPEFNESVSVSFNFLVGRNISINAVHLLPSGNEIVSPIVVRNDDTALMGYFLQLTKGQWILALSTSSTINVSYLVLIKIQHLAWSLENAVELENDTRVSEAFLIPNERHFWKVTMEKNQRGTMLVTTRGLSLLGAILQVYAESNIFQPIFEVREEQSLQSNVFNVSWVAEAKQSYIVVLIAGSELKDEINPYYIKFQKNGRGFSFSSAIPLVFDEPLVISQPTSQTIIERYYFSFRVTSSDQPTDVEKVEIIVTEITEDVLEDAHVYLFDVPDEETPFWQMSEQDSSRDGMIRSIVEVKGNKLYYLMIEPMTSLSGTFVVEIRHLQATTFLQEFLVFVLSFVISLVVAIKSVRSYILKINPYFYDIPLKKSEFISYLKTSGHLSYLIDNYNEEKDLAHLFLPFTKISIFKVKIWYSSISTSQGEGTKIEMHYSWSRYIHVIEFSILLLILIVNQAFYYHFFNWTWTLSYLDSEVTPMVTMTTLLLVFMVTFIMIFIPRLFLSFWMRKMDEIMSILIKYPQREMLRETSRLSSQEVMNRVAYIRVLWSQAKKCLKSGQKSLFIIKADGCVKQLVYLRARQLGMSDFKGKPFLEVVEYLRVNGFDVPSRSKLKRNHDLRNKIVHRAYIPSDEEIEKSLNYYQTFISRLGLRV